MSPINRKKLKKVRDKLDKLDNQLLYLIKKRTYLVNNVIRLKQYKNEIIDKERIDLILKKIKKKSKELKIDTDITSRIWKNMIWSFINYEKKNFNKKK